MQPVRPSTIIIFRRYLKTTRQSPPDIITWSFRIPKDRCQRQWKHHLMARSTYQNCLLGLLQSLRPGKKNVFPRPRCGWNFLVSPSWRCLWDAAAIRAEEIAERARGSSEKRGEADGVATLLSFKDGSRRLKQRHKTPPSASPAPRSPLSAPLLRRKCSTRTSSRFSGYDFVLNPRRLQSQVKFR